MRILHVISSLDSRAGGPPMVISRLAAAQAGLKHDVGILYYGVAEGEGAGAAVEMDVSKLPHGAGVRCHRLPPPDKREWVTASAAKSRLRELMAETDVIHLHGIWDPILKAAAGVARRVGVPYVVAPHGMLDAWALSLKKWKKRIALALGYRRMIRGAALIHALSAYEQECIRAFGVPSPIEVIPNGVFLEEIDPLPERGSWVKERPEFAGKRWVVFLSRLHPVKGLDILARAFAALAPRFPDLDLVIVGPDYGAKEGFEALVKDLGLTPRVHLIGPLWGRERFKPIVDAACFCLPSEHEAFSVAICEAMACGAPVAISRECHMPEAETLGAGKVFERTPEALAAALEWMLADPARAKALGARARELVEERYTWPKVAARSVECYAVGRGTPHA